MSCIVLRVIPKQRKKSTQTSTISKNCILKAILCARSSGRLFAILRLFIKESISVILWTGGAESVTKGESLFAFSVSSALTVQGRKGLNHTGQADWHQSPPHISSSWTDVQYRKFWLRWRSKIGCTFQNKVICFIFMGRHLFIVILFLALL